MNNGVILDLFSKTSAHSAAFLHKKKTFGGIQNGSTEAGIAKLALNRST